MCFYFSAAALHHNIYQTGNLGRDGDRPRGLLVRVRGVTREVSVIPSAAVINVIMGIRDVRTLYDDLRS